MPLRSNRSVLRGIAVVPTPVRIWVRVWVPVWAAVTVVSAVSCRPSADVQPNDLRTYTVPRQAGSTVTAAAGPTTLERPAGGSDSMARVPGGGPRLTYDLPEGWTDEGPGGMRLATLKTGPAGAAETAEITIIPASGTLAGNAARWQEQLTPNGGQERAARAVEEAEKVPVNGVEGTVLLLCDDARENPQAILAAMIPLDDSTSLFVKFKGPAEIARGLRAPFTAFVRSIRWK